MNNRSEISYVPDMPAQAPYARHVFICTGAYCDPAGQARHIYRCLSKKLGELGDYDNPVRVKRGVTPCLGVCFGGPVLVVYPEGIWYHHVDEAVLDRIVEEHLRQGKPVQEYIFHRLEGCSGPEAGCGTAAGAAETKDISVTDISVRDTGATDVGGTEAGGTHNARQVTPCTNIIQEVA